MEARRRIPMMLGAGAVLFVAMPLVFGAETLAERCAREFRANGSCPEAVCRAVWVEQDGRRVQECRPKECPEIPPEACPPECSLMTDCSGEQICHYPMVGERPACGDLAYAGQDVPCCEGLVKRCGVEFIDGSCDMEGKHSVYNLPICIPCGDGVCGNFEDACNCPEDCSPPVLILPR